MDKQANIKLLRQMLNQEVNELMMNLNVVRRTPDKIILSIGFTDGHTHTVINDNKSFVNTTIKSLMDHLRELKR